MVYLPRVATLAAMAAGLVSAMTSTGCLKNTYVTNLPMGGGIYTQKAPFYLWGLVGEKTVDLRQVCPNGVTWFQNRQQFGDGLLSLITLGIYDPITIEVRCAGGQSYLAIPDASDRRTWFYATDDQGQLLQPPTAGPALALSGGAL